eukprot:TRINITY_DN74886_c0_g1_i1.p1 TRINITY_DN74886_c0_g1~~TRINITY_DN74886_c0_g1_i1.p1  ORF type:complete len:650 (-),score=166.06 TRINITY_DN74886_c0_g1_i1:65-2014(-)
MNFFKQILSVDKANELVERAKAAAKDAAEAASNLSDTVQAEYRRTFVELDCTIHTIRDDLLIMEFPDEEKISRLASRLNTDYAQKMMILNMSERKYDRAMFSGEVVDVAFRGLPAPPLEMLFELCLSTCRWLMSDPSNVVVVHCFQNFSRSILFASCLLAFRGFYPDPVDALHDVCRVLRIDDAASVLPSQRRYLTYFQRCQSGFVPTRERFRLIRVQIKPVPVFEAEGSVALRPYIEVWNHGELVHSSLPVWHTSRGSGDSPSEKSDGGGPTTLPPAVGKDEPCVFFTLDCAVHGDVLLRIRHVFQGGNRDTVCRLAFHTSLVPQGFQFRKAELDGACDDPRVPDECFLDLTFEPVDNPVSAADGQTAASQAAEAFFIGETSTMQSPVFKKARELSARLQSEEEERQRQREEAEKQRQIAEEQAASSASAAAMASSGSTERDEFEELEKTLLRGGGSGPPPAATAASGAAADGDRVPSARGEGGDDAGAELRRALAAATADDSPTPAAAAVLGSGYGGGASTTAAVAAPSATSVVAEAAAPATASAPPSAESAVPAKAQAPSVAAPAASTDKKGEDVKAVDDIDALFGEFDAALEFSGGPVLKKEDGGGDKAAPSAVGGITKSTPAADSKNTDDLFNDVDAFLKELDT